MTAENQTESSPAENQELPTPEFSASGDSSTSGGAEDIVSKLTPVIEQIVQRTVQSTKDKRISKLEKAVGLDLLAELDEQGVAIPKDVRTELRLRELEGRGTPQPAQPAQPVDNGMSQQKAAVTDAIAELQKHGLDTNDAGFLGILRGKYQSRAEFDLAVSRHVVAKLAPPKPANPADVVQSPSTTQTTVSAGQLQSNYEQERNQIAQNMRGDAKVKALSDLKVKYRQAGLSI